MLPVQFCIRKKVKVRSGCSQWRKGGTQKKDGFWAIVRKHVARRAVRTTDRDTLRHMSYFFQWLYWRSAHPVADAFKGRRSRAPSMDLFGNLGGMFREARPILGEELFDTHGKDWFSKVSVDAFDIFEGLPCPRKRVLGKTSQ